MNEGHRSLLDDKSRDRLDRRPRQPSLIAQKIMDRRDRLDPGNGLSQGIRSFGRLRLPELQREKRSNSLEIVTDAVVHFLK